MRILHILNHIEEIGNGIVNVAIDLACLQAKQGHTVCVASAGGSYEQLLENYDAKHFCLDQTRSPFKLLTAVRRFCQIIDEFQPDIIHAHMMTGVVLARSLRGHSSYRIISTVHNEFQPSAILMGLADSVIAVSQAVADLMHQRGIPQPKLHVIPNGTLGSPRVRPIDDYDPAPLKHTAITTVAGMFERKGIAELIDAFCTLAPAFPNIHLYLVGNGPDKERFEKQAKTYNFPDRIHFEGFQSEPQSYFKATDIFVLASHKDPSPLVISEAREAGCAVVATEVDGIPEALDFGEAGLLVPPHDSQYLAETLKQLLQHPDSLNHWRRQSRRNLERLRVERVCSQTLSVYERSM